MKNIIKLFGVRGLLCVIVLAAVIGLGLTACRDSGVGDGDEYWLISSQRTYSVKDGKVIEDNYSQIEYSWIAYNYTNETNYEEEYTTRSGNSYSTNNFRYSTQSKSDYHFIRNGQTSSSTTETYSYTYTYTSDNGTETKTVSSGTSSTTYTYDLASGLTASSTTVSSGVTTGAYYSIELLSDTDDVKTYKYNAVGSSGYSIYKIQKGKTLEASNYDANSVLISTTTYTQPDNKEIREKLPNFRLSSTQYYSSSYVNSSYQTVDVIDNDYSDFSIRVRTFTDGVLSSQTDYDYTLFTNNKYDYDEGDGEKEIWDGEKWVETKKWGDYRYTEENGKIIITEYTNKKNRGIANIPAQINGKPVTGIGTRVDICFRDCYKLTGVTIPDSVTDIYSSFDDCWSLASITIPYSVTRIGNPFFGPSLNITWYYNPSIQMWGEGEFRAVWVFRDLLKTVIIPDGVSIGEYTFTSCEKLTSVKIGSGVILGTYAFDGDFYEKYKSGGAGTYTRSEGSDTWTKN